ncbi:MAG: polysaccharide deacetylase family protein [archaeon]|nr:polysaccharide deacetylase family protein [archaeon]
MRPLSISIDVEPDLHTNAYNSVKAIPNLLRLFKKYNVKATFFTTCDCIEKYPSVFKSIKKEGHEISLHGYKHHRFDNLSLDEKENDIKKSIACFKKYLKTKPAGFRAPQHSIDRETMNLLEKYYFKYDSSLIPWNFYHLIFFWKIKVKFMNNFSPMKIHKINNLYEIPISSFIMPFSSITLRILPLPLLKMYFHLIDSYKEPVFLMHSWDLIEIPDSKIYNLCPIDEFMKRFEFMLEFFSHRRKYAKIDELISTN